MRKKFCGQYYKCQSPTQTLALIPAKHGGNSSVQLICDDGAWIFSDVENCTFSSSGLKIDLREKGISAVGELKFGELSPIKYDIMGPFKCLPFMQCRHSVISMRHSVDGLINVNGTEYGFENALGYIEGDRGYSFPGKYAWTQCFINGGSLMLSLADIPLAGFHFTGIICVILWQGKEYRLATYLGARVLKIANGEIIIAQGDYRFSARLIERHPLPLAAPVKGSMVRTIHESASCKAAYRFEKNGKALFDFETHRASFEYEYGEDDEQTCK